MDIPLVPSCFYLSQSPSYSVRETELSRMQSKDLETLRGPVLVKVSITGIKHQEQKQFGEERVYFRLQHSAHSLIVRARAEGRDLETEIEAKAMEECCLLAFSSWLAQSATFYNPGPPVQGRWAGPPVV